MKRILFVTNALSLSEDVLRFAVSIAGVEKNELTGMFIHDASFWSAPGVSMVAGQTYVEEIVPDAEERKAVADKTDANVTRFTEACVASGITSKVIREAGSPIDIILKESRFADYIIVDPLLSFTGDEHIPTSLVKDILHNAECPVLLSGDAHRPLEEVVIAYNGSAAAVAAAKQFCYQMPELSSKRITVLRANEEGNDNESDDTLESFLVWLRMHCPNITVTTVDGAIGDVLFSYFMDDTDNWQKMLVAGAFGRSAFSRFFKPGAAEVVVKATATPVFIAHH